MESTDIQQALGITALELPDMKPLTREVLSLLRWPVHQKSWQVPLGDMLKVAWEGEHDLDIQLHGVVKIEDVSVLCRWTEVAPMVLYPEWPEINAVDYDDMPRPVQDWLGEERWRMTEGLSPLIDAFWPVVEGETDRAGGFAIAVRQLPFVVVEMGGWLGFALTGAGTNLTAQIAEAYIRCGFYPPADLGVDGDSEHEAINEAILRSKRSERDRLGGSVVADEMKMERVS